MTFEQDFLAKIAAALNVPADLMAQDYDARQTPEDRAYRRLVRRYEEEMEMRRIRFQGAINNAVFALYIETDGVRLICGYDPQKLLPDTRKTYRRWVDERGIHTMLSFRLPRPENDPIERFFRDDDRLWHHPEPLGEPYIDPIFPGDEIKLMRPRERTYEHKMARLAVGYGMGWSDLEARVLAMQDDPRVRVIVLDIECRGGDLPGNPQMDLYCLGASLALKEEKTVATGRGKRDMDYLKHDPTKRHRRPK